VDSFICTPSTTYPSVNSKHAGMTVSQVTDKIHVQA